MPFHYQSLIMNVTGVGMTPNGNTTSLAFDMMPLNGRHIKAVSTRIVFTLSCLLNAILIALLVTEKNTMLKAYSNVLLLNCICDLLLTVSSLVTDVQAECIYGQIVGIIGGTHSQLNHWWTLAGIEFWLGTLYLSIFFIPLVCYFRYCLVVRGEKMTMQELLQYFTLPIIAAVFVGSWFTIACHMDEHEMPCEEALSHPIWSHAGASYRNCFMAGTKNPYMIIYVIMIALTLTLVYSLMGYFTWHIFNELNSAQLSEKTAKIHRQMNILLFVQLLLPIVCAGLPLAMIIVFSLTSIKGNGNGLLIVGSLEWIPLMNPLITILFVTNYRRRAIRGLLYALRLTNRVRVKQQTVSTVSETALA